MISADAPVLFSKACELFILELTLRAWLETEEGKRRTLQRSDIARAIRQEEALDFLVDVVPLINQKVFFLSFPLHSCSILYQQGNWFIKYNIGSQCYKL